MRNAIVNVAETVCYDITKDTLLYYNILQNGIPLHFSAAAAAGQSPQRHGIWYTVFKGFGYTAYYAVDRVVNEHTSM